MYKFPPYSLDFCKNNYSPLNQWNQISGRSGQPGKQFPSDYVGNFHASQQKCMWLSQLLAMFYTCKY